MHLHNWGIRLTQVDATYTKLQIDSTTPYILRFCRGHQDSLLNQSEEEFATKLRRPAIESEGILIQVEVQMRGTHCSLMSSLQPSLQQRSHSIHQRQQVFTHILGWPDNDVPISGRNQPSVARPTVGTDDSARLHTLLYGRHQTCCRGIRNPTKSNSPDVVAFIFNCNKDQRLTRCTSPSFSRPFTTDIGFVNLHSSRQTISPGSYHGCAKFMKPYPYGFISPEPQNSLESHGTHSILLTDYVPNRPKPQLKRFSRVLENGPSRYGGLIPASRAMVQFPTGQPRLIMSATRASKTFRPSKVEYVLQACFLGVKPSFKFY